MRKREAFAMAMASLGLALLGPLLRADSRGVSLPKFSHSRDITHPFLPLASLTQDVLDGREGGKVIRVERSLKPDLHKSFKMDGQSVEALAVEDRELENGQLAEVTIDFFAQADDGAVYYLGEMVDEYKDGKVTGHSGAWMLGVDTQTPGVLLPGHPKVGDKFRSEDVPKITREDDQVFSISETVETPSGTYRDCLKIREVLSDGKVESKYYAKGIGCVKEVTEEGELLLKSHTSTGPSGNANQSPTTPQGGQSAKEPIQDPMARVALAFVGASTDAEEYWYGAINDPTLSGQERQDLIEDLNEDGISDPENPSVNDLPLILSRIRLLQVIGAFPLDDVNAAAFAEAYKDLTAMVTTIRGGAGRVPGP